MRKNTCLLILLLSFSGTLLGQETPEVKVPDFNSQIAPLLTKYCVACHNADDAEGGLRGGGLRLAGAGVLRLWRPKTSFGGGVLVKLSRPSMPAGSAP